MTGVGNGHDTRKNRVDVVHCLCVFWRAISTACASSQMRKVSLIVKS